MLQPRHIRPLYRQRTGEYTLLDRPGSIDFAKYPLPDRLPNRWYADHNSRSELAKVTKAVAHRRVRKSLDPAITKCHSNEIQSQFDDVFQNMCEREICE